MVKGKNKNEFLRRFPIIIISFLMIVSFCSLMNKSDHWITCSAHECEGQYTGAEFVRGDDIAHQFSNKMSVVVGDQLKKLFRQGDFSKVDFDHIEMTTKGMGSGYVTYYLKIPFKRVSKRCEAYTSFDHVGGWNHRPALKAREKQLSKVLLPNEKLYVSNLKTTPEGLQEYWIQWKNKITQLTCK